MRHELLHHISFDSCVPTVLNHRVFMETLTGQEAFWKLVLSCVLDISVEQKSLRGTAVDCQSPKLQHSVALCLLLAKASVFHPSTVAVFPLSTPNYHSKAPHCYVRKTQLQFHSHLQEEITMQTTEAAVHHAKC